MTNRILVFIPMYNCEKQISRVIAQFDATACELIEEILVVDNGSKDDGLNAAKNALSNLQNIKCSLVQNRDNYNLGGSNKVAFNYALEKGFDYVVVLHGDDQGSIADLIPHLKNQKHQNYDSFLGSRFAYRSTLVGYSKFRTFGNYAVNLLCSVAGKRLITDTGSGLNIYKTSYLKDKFYLYFPNNLTFNVYMLFYGIWSKSKFDFFALKWREDDQISNAKVFKQGLTILKLVWLFLLCPKNLFGRKENQYSAINYQFNVIYSNKGDE